jgi:hypothetical protein
MGLDVIGADCPRRVEPEARDLREHLTFEGNGRQNPVERAQPIGRNHDPASIGKVVTVSDLALAALRQFRDRGSG